MNKWIIAIGLVVVSIGVIFWAMAPLLVTYAQIVPDVAFEVGDKSSIEKALILVEQEAISYFREIYGDSILIVSLLAIFNAIIAIWFLFKPSNK